MGTGSRKKTKESSHGSTFQACLDTNAGHRVGEATRRSSELQQLGQHMATTKYFSALRHEKADVSGCQQTSADVSGFGNENADISGYQRMSADVSIFEKRRSNL